MRSSPQSGDTYGAGETIAVEVRFDGSVKVEGPAFYLLVVGRNNISTATEEGTAELFAAHRRAYFVRGRYPSVGFGGYRCLSFEYVVQPSDRDSDGIELIQPYHDSDSEATITNAFGRGIVLSLQDAVLPVTDGHKVNGANITAPSVSSVEVTSSTASGVAYGAGERIEVTVGFDIAVDVTGAPQLALTVGTSTVQAAYLRGSGTRTLTFGYVVQSADVDANGIEVGASALTLNAGTIRSSFGGVAAGGVAALSLGSHALSAAADHKVNGATATAPVVTAMSITSSPASGDTYGAGETISVEVGFNIPVVVTGAPQLALAIGSGTGQAAYASGSDTTALRFDYTVLATDSDSVGIRASALRLNAGTIQSWAGTNAMLRLGGGGRSTARRDTR